jgi:gamma-glutamylcyclotransferase (GGCT)/AIG2-like uncharacterized protein YtfP
MLLVVYGTLREGEALSSMLAFVRPKSKVEIITLPIEMYVVGGCPGVKIPDPKTQAKMTKKNSGIRLVTAELWDINMGKRQEAYILTYLDRVEGVDQGLYARRHIDTPKGKAWIYNFGPAVKGCLRIYDWKEWQATPKEEKAKALAELMKSNGMIISAGKVMEES